MVAHETSVPDFSSFLAIQWGVRIRQFAGQFGNGPDCADQESRYRNRHNPLTESRCTRVANFIPTVLRSAAQEIRFTDRFFGTSCLYHSPYQVADMYETQRVLFPGSYDRTESPTQRLEERNAHGDGEWWRQRTYNLS